MNLRVHNMCVYAYVYVKKYVYIYIYIHTHMTLECPGRPAHAARSPFEYLWPGDPSAWRGIASRCT